MERYISKFSANGHVKLGPVRRSYSSISFAPREELIVFANQIWKPLFLSGVQFLFDDCHSPLSPTTFFEIGVCPLDVHSQRFYFLELDQTTNRKLRYSVFFFPRHQVQFQGVNNIFPFPHSVNLRLTQTHLKNQGSGALQSTFLPS